MDILLIRYHGVTHPTRQFLNSKSNHMKKSTAQTIAIILLALAICTADSWFNF